MTVYDFIKKHESCSLKPYHDPTVGICIGWARNLNTSGGFRPTEQTYFEDKYGPNWCDRMGMGGAGIDQDDADMLLVNDVCEIVDQLVPFNWFKQLDIVRKAVIIAMCYQLGVPGLLQFHHMLAAVVSGDWHTAAKFGLQSKWASQTPRRAVETMNMLEDGQWPNP